MVCRDLPAPFSYRELHTEKMNWRNKGSSESSAVIWRYKEEKESSSRRGLCRDNDNRNLGMKNLYQVADVFFNVFDLV